MASIAHVVARETIEFHRLYSHRKMVFWRFNTKNFSDFNKQDYIFFLSKTRKREKGLIGFGQLKEIKNLKTTSLFKKYKSDLGYKSQQEFYEELKKISKSETLPDKLNCLFLENVTYFKNPIYLSEFGFELNKQVESYIYLDTHSNITSQILSKANQIGLDLWSQSQDTFNQSLKALSKLYKTALIIRESGLFKGQFKHYFGEPLMMVPQVHYEILTNKPILYLPITSNNKKEHYSVLGLISQIEKLAEIKIVLNKELQLIKPLYFYPIFVNDREYLEADFK